MSNKAANIFTEKDLENLDIERINKEGLKNLYSKGKNQWWNIGFRFWLKGNQRRFVGINPRKDEGFILKSNKYGKFKVSFLGKILADFMNDNNEIYIINRELKKVGEKHGWEADVDDGYFANERFCYIILHNLYYDWSDIIKKVLEMAIERKEFIKIIQTFEEWEYFLQENKYESA